MCRGARFVGAEDVKGGDDDTTHPAIVFGLLGPVFDWTDEQRAAAEPAPESNVISLADYKQRLN
jgi:hypothetical protein